MITAPQFEYMPSDIVVTGVPRSGETLVLQILDALQHGGVRRASELVKSCLWIEGPFSRVMKGQQRRLIKTHMPLDSILGTDAQHKVIMVLRDPMDIRLSWYRHVRSMFKKCSPHGADFDKCFTCDDFASASIPIPTINPSSFIRASEPEYFASQALRAYHETENVLVVFYEEIFRDPQMLIDRLAKFTNCMRAPVNKFNNSVPSPGEMRILEKKKREQAQLVASICESIIVEERHPHGGRRNGSSGQGSVCFSRESLEDADANWENFVRKVPNRATPIASYEQLYHHIVKTPYVFAEPNKRQTGGIAGRTGALVAAASTPTKNLIVKPRKFGESLLKKMNRPSSLGTRESSSASARSSSHSVTALHITLPLVYVCIDPDDPDTMGEIKT